MCKEHDEKAYLPKISILLQFLGVDIRIAMFRQPHTNPCNFVSVLNF